MSAEGFHQDDPSDGVDVNLSNARPHLSDYAEKAKQGQTVYLTNRGKRVAALVPVDVAEAHAELEDTYWARRAAEAEESGIISWDEAIIALEGGDR
ncbi:type II toxin-antitoxin system Phd/YefM family antitoxin [Bounagaea algeriensis]